MSADPAAGGEAPTPSMPTRQAEYVATVELCAEQVERSAEGWLDPNVLYALDECAKEVRALAALRPPQADAVTDQMVQAGAAAWRAHVVDDSMAEWTDEREQRYIHPIVRTILAAALRVSPPAASIPLGEPTDDEVRAAVLAHWARMQEGTPKEGQPPSDLNVLGWMAVYRAVAMELRAASPTAPLTEGWVFSLGNEGIWVGLNERLRLNALGDSEAECRSVASEAESLLRDELLDDYAAYLSAVQPDASPPDARDEAFLISLVPELLAFAGCNSPGSTHEATFGWGESGEIKILGVDFYDCLVQYGAKVRSAIASPAGSTAGATDAPTRCLNVTEGWACSMPKGHEGECEKPLPQTTASAEPHVGRRPFSELRDRMSLESRQRAEERAEEILASALPLEECFCGGRLETRTAEFEARWGEASVMIADEWLECVKCGERLYTPALADQRQRRIYKALAGSPTPTTDAPGGTA